MAARQTFKDWFRDFLNKLLPVVTGIAITFTLQGIVNRSHERKSVRSAMELVRTELQSNLDDINHLNDFLKQEVISAQYLSDHQSSLFPKVGDNDLSMEIIRAYDACELLQTDINRHYSRSGDRVPWLQLNDLKEYTLDIQAAIDAIGTFLMK